MLRILGQLRSINVRKVLCTCAELGLSFEREDWGAGFRSPQDPAFLALNPNGLVPVLIDGDFVLWESNTISRYLAAREQRVDLLPTDLQDRARVEQWMDWQATELNNAWMYAFVGLVRGNPAYQDATRIAASISAWNRQMQLLNQQLIKAGGFVVGPGFTLADVGIGLATHRWFQSPIERPVLDAVAAYYAQLRTRPMAAYFDAGGP
jgi:glutathione S-transferase